MSLVRRIPTILEEGKLRWEVAEAVTPILVEKLTEYEGIKTDSTESGNSLICADNLGIMKHYVKEGFAGGIDLIYIDPPYYSKSDYGSEIKLRTSLGDTVPVIKQKAYRDSWEKGMDEYLKMLTARLYGSYELLSEKGSFWIHLDWHAVHYIKVILDEVFGEKNFVNEVIWNYKSGGVSKRRFARKHDTLLFYSKTKDYRFNPLEEKSYNREFRKYSFKDVDEYRDDVGWYTIVNMKDVWNLDMVGRTSAERTGYATQKPEKLMERIIESCSNEGDLCADFFAGSSTLAAAAGKMNRRFLSCDSGKLATVNSEKRLIESGLAFSLYNTSGIVSESKATPDISVNEEGNITKVVLQGYALSNDFALPVSEEHRSLIMSVSEEDPLQLVDYWSVDFDYDGNFFKPDVCIYKKKDDISNEAVSIKSTGDHIAVRVVDIFGNDSFKIL